MDSGLVVLDECLSYRGGRLNRFIDLYTVYYLKGKELNQVVLGKRTLHLYNLEGSSRRAGGGQMAISIQI